MSDFDAYLPWQVQFHAILDERFYTGPWLDGEVWSGRIRCWADDEAAILARIKTYPTGAKVVEGMAAAGDLDGILDLITRAEEWGREQGCLAAEIGSRAGWKKTLSTEGYELFQTMLRKELC